MIRRAVVGGLATVVVATVAQTSHAESRALAEGVAAYERADFDAALRALAQVLRDPAATRADLVAAHQHLLTIHAAAGDLAAAAPHAAMVLALAPAAVALPSAPPAVATLLARAREQRRGVPLALAVDAVLPGDAALPPGVGVRVRARATGAPATFAGRVALQCTAAGAPWQGRAQTPRAAQGPAAAAEIAVPPLRPEQTLACAATLATDAGVVLARASWRARAARRGLPGWALGTIVAGSALAVAVGVVLASLAATGVLTSNPPQEPAAWLGPPRFAR